MKKRNLIYLPLLCSMLFAACKKDFLDRKLDTNYTEKEVFASYGTMRDFAYGIYTYLPQGFERFGGAMLDAATDDGLHAGANTTIQQLTNGGWGPFSNPDNQWGNLYIGIRKANLFLEKSADYKEIIKRDLVTPEGITAYKRDSTDMSRLRAESRFLRAYFYFELIKRYGGVPLIVKTLSAEDDLKLKRNTFEECTAFIANEIEAVIGDLAPTWSGIDNSNKIGRGTKGAALALKSRALLYAASPLHNTSNDSEKWSRAAKAAHAVIELNRYSLQSNYRDLFRLMQSNEFIFERRYTASNSFERTTYPVGFEGAIGGINPSQGLVDAYETTKGRAIADDSDYDPQNPYVNRDPRLQMTLIVNNSDYKGRKVELWSAGLDGPGKPRASKTGYYLKKYSDEGLNLLQNRTSSHAWVYFRYAEILLNYAEAMNEAFGPDVAPAGFSKTASQALNDVRKRGSVNMPAVTGVSREEFRLRVRNERRVELAFEEHRFWDVRRWKIGTETLGKPVLGIAITRLSNNSFLYNSAIPVENRVFNEKMYLYPIPRTEIDKSVGVIIQNTGW
ncbi:RagB/SusD family nutrient uptake outer membrane protein [Pedobacter sp. B4-66]|uniref:RagB/SusD family nutrient uptake outer membrane protein n=1 Tax=Pedobacter sp. B4-66 TaxID=2817280 RepID=UPI001BDA8EDB|nr:RagB/SusD family nutrient uptake outer membrane protein [Pedobacter sp. B4-66]